MSVISPAPSSDTSNKRRILEKWEDKHVRLLIESYLKCKDLFGKPQLSKKKVFDKIAEEFNRTSDVVVTGDQCFRKFKKLEAKQKEIEDNNSKTGREKKTWKFHKEMEDCMGDNPTVKPVFTFDTSRGSSPSSSTRSSTSNLDEGLNSDSDSQETEAGCSSSKRPKRKRKQKSSASEMLDFLKDYTAKREKVEEEKLSILKAMQEEKKEFFSQFLLFLKIPKRNEYLLRNSIGRNILGLRAFQY